jgi:hypothetical protein
MRAGRLVLAGVLGLALLNSAGAGDTDPKGRQFETDLRLLRGDPHGSTEKGTVEVLTRPTLRALARQEARVSVGQTVRVAGELRDVGNTFRVVVEPAAGGKVRLRVTAQVTEVVEDPTTRQPAVRTVVERTTFTREAKLGETLRVRVGKPGKTETWVELRAREVQ